MAGNVIEVIIRAKDEATAELKGINGQLGQLAIVAAGVTAAATAVATTLATMAIQGGKAADELRVTGLQMGLTATETAKLDFAATQLDSNLPAVSSGIKFMNRTLYEAKSGGAEAQQTLKALGFSAKELAAGLGPPNEAFLKVIDRLGAIDDTGTRAALSMKVFGRGALELTPLILAGSGAIKQAQDSLEALGGTVSVTSAALGDEFGDAMLRVTAQVRGLKSQIAEALLPSMIEVVGAASRAIASFNLFTRSHQVLTQATFQTAAQIAAIGVAVGGSVLAITLAQKAMLALGIQVAGLTGPIGIAIAALTALAFAINATRAQAEKPFKVGIVTDAKSAGEDLARLSAQRQKLIDEIGSIKERGSFKGTGPASPTGDGKDFVDPNARRLEELRKQLKLTEQSIKTSAESAKVFGATVAQAGTDGAAGIGKIGVATENLVEQFNLAMQRAYSISEQLGESLRKTFGLKVAASLIPDIQKAVDSSTASLPKDSNSRPTIKIPEGQDAHEYKVDVIVNTDQLDAIPARLHEADEPLAGMLDLFEQIGVNVEALTDKLVAVGTTLESIGAVGIIMSETLQAALKDAFDPLKNQISDTLSAVGEFKASFDESFNALFDNVLLKGKGFFESFRGFLGGLANALKQLIVSLIAAIAKALVLKALGGLLGGPAGVVVQTIGSASTGGTARLASGGSIAPQVHMASGGTFAPMRRAFAAMAMGGAISAGAFAPVHAAQGMRVLPGFPQAFDSIDAKLSPGEVVLPTIGGHSPANAVASLVQLSKDVTNIVQGQQTSNTTVRQAVGTVNVYAHDADSVRNSIRRGEFFDQLQLAAELGR